MRPGICFKRLPMDAFRTDQRRSGTGWVPSGLPRDQEAGAPGPGVPGSGGLTLALLEQYADEHTRAVALSSVEFSDGYAADLQAIGQWCHERGIFLVVDGAQSLGVMPMDVKKISH